MRESDEFIQFCVADMSVTLYNMTLGLEARLSFSLRAALSPQHSYRFHGWPCVQRCNCMTGVLTFTDGRVFKGVISGGVLHEGIMTLVLKSRFAQLHLCVYARIFVCVCAYVCVCV